MDIFTGTVVDAEQLWLLDEVDASRYQCISCGAALRPAGYRTDAMRRRPYFGLERSAKHAPNCRMATYKDLVVRARQERISFEELRQFNAMPDLVKFRSLVPRTPGPERGPSMRRVAAAYCSFPHNRDHPLQIDEVAGQTYAEVIQRLPVNEIVRYARRSVWFGRVACETSPLESNSLYEISLREGEPRINKPQRAYRVRVHWFSWHPNARLALMREIEALLQEHRGNQVSRQYAPWLFFIGDQDARDPALFHVRDYRHLCTRYEAIQPTAARAISSGPLLEAG